MVGLNDAEGLNIFKQIFSSSAIKSIAGSEKISPRTLRGSSRLCAGALTPVTTYIKINPSWFDYCDTEAAVEYVNTGRGSRRLFKAHKAELKNKFTLHQNKYPVGNKFIHRG